MMAAAITHMEVPTEMVPELRRRCEQRYGVGWTDPLGVFGSDELTPEGKVKRRVKDLLDAMNVWYTTPQTGGYGNSGIPDFLCCVQGKLLAIECKAGNNEPTALQLREHERIRAAGGTVVVVNEDGYDVLAVTLSVMKNKGET